MVSLKQHSHSVTSVIVQNGCAQTYSVLRVPQSRGASSFFPGPRRCGSFSWLVLCLQHDRKLRAWPCRVLRCGSVAKAEALLRQFKGQQLEVESAITAARVQVSS